MSNPTDKDSNDQSTDSTQRITDEMRREAARRPAPTVQPQQPDDVTVVRRPSAASGTPRPASAQAAAPAPVRRAPARKRIKRAHVVDPALTREGSLLGPLLLGLLLLALIAWFAIKHYTPHIQKDLLRRSTEALQIEGLSDSAFVEIDGRNAILKGTVASGADSDRAETAVANTFGIRNVDNQLSLARTSRQAATDRQASTFSISRNGDRATISGTVSAQHYADALQESATSAFGADNIEGSIELADGITNPGWLPALPELLSDVAELPDGALEITGDALTLRGTADTNAQRAALEEKATNAVGGLLAVNNEIASLEPAEEPTTAEQSGAAEQTDASGDTDSTQSADQPAGDSAEQTTGANEPSAETEDGAETGAQSEAEAGAESEAETGAEAEAEAESEAGAQSEAEAGAEADSQQPGEESAAAVEQTDSAGQAADAEPSEPAPLASLGISNRAEGIELRGAVGSEQGKAALLEQARTVYGQDNVIDAIDVNPDITDPQWVTSIGGSFADVKSLKHGNLSIGNGAAFLTGTTNSPSAKAAIEQKLADAFGTDTDFESNLMAIADRPASLLIKNTDAEIALSGNLPPTSAEQLLGVVQANSPLPIIDLINVDDRVIEPDWVEPLTQSVTQLDGIEQPSVEIDADGTLILGGQAESAELSGQAAARVAELFPDSVSLRNDIAVKTPTIVEPKPVDISTLLAGIDLSGIRFGSNSAELTSESLAILDAVADALAQAPETSLEIGGHTDSLGDYNYNLDLSAARAEAVRRQLASRGIADERMFARGYGPDQPIATNDTRAGRASNRRIEFKIITGD